MGTYNELPVYKSTYDLLLEMFRFTKDFNKEYKWKSSSKKSLDVGFCWLRKCNTGRIGIILRNR
jgi:hypothetical protein